MPSVPDVPALDGIRPAIPDDLPRIATVAAAGFFHSPTFQYQRIYYAAYPDDTLLSYLTEYARALQTCTSIVLVAEDTVNEAEDIEVYPALREAVAYAGSDTPGSKIVVGVATIDVKASSSCIGLFQPTCSTDESEVRILPTNPKRDICKERVRKYDEATAPAKARHLRGRMRLSTLAVHPAYWRRGHATRLIHWITQLADLHGASLGISAVPQGAIIAARAGFEERELVRVKEACAHESMTGTKGQGAEVQLWVAVRCPSGTPVSGDSSGDSATSAESQ